MEISSKSINFVSVKLKDIRDMITDKNIDIFINWLVDNNYFNEFVHTFKVNNNTFHNIFFELKKRLKETNVVDFVDIFSNNEEKSKEWKEYYNLRYSPNECFVPHKGDYIVYSIIRNDIACQYISIVDKVEKVGDLYIYEFCSVCVKSDDEELVDTLDYDMEFCLSEVDGVTGFRYATPDEKKILNDFLKEDGLIFDTKINKIVNL